MLENINKFNNSGIYSVSWCNNAFENCKFKDNMKRDVDRKHCQQVLLFPSKEDGNAANLTDIFK